MFWNLCGPVWIPSVRLLSTASTSSPVSWRELRAQAWHPGSLVIGWASDAPGWARKP